MLTDTNHVALCPSQRLKAKTFERNVRTGADLLKTCIFRFAAGCQHPGTWQTGSGLTVWGLGFRVARLRASGVRV